MQASPPQATTAVRYASPATPPPPVSKKVVVSLAPSLNTPASAEKQPDVAKIPSYSPKQTPEVEQSRADTRQQVQRRQIEVQQQHIQQKIQVADQRMASDVLTGEYSASGAQKVGSPRIGGYLTASA